MCVDALFACISVHFVHAFRGQKRESVLLAQKLSCCVGAGDGEAGSTLNHLATPPALDFLFF